MDESGQTVFDSGTYMNECVRLCVCKYDYKPLTIETFNNNGDVGATSGMYAQSDRVFRAMLGRIVRHACQWRSMGS